jgi:hypothetical protein
MVGLRMLGLSGRGRDLLRAQNAGKLGEVVAGVGCLAVQICDAQGILLGVLGFGNEVSIQDL